MKYDAFISYRHSTLDMEVAKKLHTALETYKVPAAVQKKTGKKKISRVFRDQEELPIGSDLDDNILGALTESEYLLVICSPRAVESEWVGKEIDSFIKLHGRRNVLAVLVEGEPNESFPPQLLVDEEGNKVEPLAADIRGVDSKERNKKFKTEILRLIAPILGCSFDDLRQRHRERIVKRTITLVSSAAAIVAALGVGFGLYSNNVAKKMETLANEKSQLADEKTQLATEMEQLATEKSQLADEKTELADEVQAKLREIQITQSRYLADTSLSLLATGDKRAAVLVALAALPSEEDDRPYVADAEYALSTALYAYENGTNIGVFKNLNHDSLVRMMARSDDANELVTIDRTNAVTVWDLNTGNALLVHYVPLVSDEGSTIYVEDANVYDDLLFVFEPDGAGDRLRAFDYEDNMIYESEQYDSCTIIVEEGVAIMKRLGSWEYVYDYETMESTRVDEPDVVEIIDLSTREVIATYENPFADKSIYKPVYNGECNVFAYSSYDVLSDGEAAVLMATEGSEEFVYAYTAGHEIGDLVVTDNGNVATFSYPGFIGSAGTGKIAGTLELFNPSTGSKIWSVDLDVNVMDLKLSNIIMKERVYEEDGVTYNEIILVLDSNCYTFDEFTGEIISQASIGTPITAIYMSAGRISRLGDGNGKIHLIGFETGYLYEDNTIDVGRSVYDLTVGCGKLAIRTEGSNEILLLNNPEAEDLEEIISFDHKMKGRGISPDGKYAVFADSSGDHWVYLGYTTDGEYLFEWENVNDYSLNASGFSKDNKLILVGSKGELVTMDFETKTVDEINILKNKSIDLTYVYFGNILLCEDTIVYYDSTEVEAVSISANEELYHLETSYNYKTFSKVLLSSDEKMLYLIFEDLSMKAVNLQTGEETEYGTEFLGAYPALGDFYWEPAVSSDGKYLAMNYADGYVRLFDLEKTECINNIEQYTNTSCNIGFDEKTEHVFIQGDDGKLKVFELASNQIISAFDTEFGDITWFGEDEEDGILAFSDYNNMLLLDMETYSPIAYIEDGFRFVAEDNSIYEFFDGKTLFRTHYKDYKELIELAKKQYDGQELTQEEKNKYNID